MRRDALPAATFHLLALRFSVRREFAASVRPSGSQVLNIISMWAKFTFYAASLFRIAGAAYGSLSGMSQIRSTHRRKANK